jgi:hypothetical protein
VKNKTWDVEYQTYRLRAINKISLFPPKTSEVLEINGIIVESIKGGFFRSCSTILTKYNFNGTEREIEVRFAKKTELSGLGCQFFIDGQKIGGDRTIKYPDPQESTKHIEKGFIKYFLSIGLLSWLPYAIGMGFADLGSPLLLRIQRFIIYLLTGSLFRSYFSWNGMKSTIEYRNNYNRLNERIKAAR